MSFGLDVKDENGQGDSTEEPDMDVDILDTEKQQDQQDNRRLKPSNSQKKLQPVPEEPKSPRSPRKAGSRPQSALAKYGAVSALAGTREESRPASSLGNASSEKSEKLTQKQAAKRDAKREMKAIARETPSQQASRLARKQPTRHVTLKDAFDRAENTSPGFESEDDELQEEPVQKLRARSFSRFNLIKRRSTKAEYASEFQRLVKLMRQYNYTLAELQTMRDDFNEFDTSGEGVLKTDEFLQVVRKRCGLSASEPVPQHLVHPDWLLQFMDGGVQSACIDFETYLTWSMSKAYAEEMMVPDPNERHLRRVARDNNLLLPDVENVKGVFDSFDEDKSDHIDEAEFEKVIYVLMNARNPSDISPNMLKRFWREVDNDGSGAISFEEFLLWYFKFMGRA